MPRPERKEQPQLPLRSSNTPPSSTCFVKRSLALALSPERVEEDEPEQKRARSEPSPKEEARLARRAPAERLWIAGETGFPPSRWVRSPAKARDTALPPSPEKAAREIQRVDDAPTM